MIIFVNNETEPEWHGYAYAGKFVCERPSSRDRTVDVCWRGWCGEGFVLHMSPSQDDARNACVCLGSGGDFRVC